jgi:hypothetical protein
MKIVDPLVTVEPGRQTGLPGWAVAAAIIARLQEVGIDVPAILGPALSDLAESELDELARHLAGPLMDGQRCFGWRRAGSPLPLDGASDRPVG